MIALKGRRRCAKCGKHYGWYHAKPNTSDYESVKYKGKSDNSCIADEVKILSQSSAQIKLHCPECGSEEIFIYTY